MTYLRTHFMNKQTYFLGLVAIAMVVVIAGCIKDKEPTASSNCDPNKIPTYTDTIKAILDNNCVSCHGAGGQKPTLTNYADAKAAATKVKNSMNGTGKVMPPSGLLSAKIREKVNCWVENGQKE